MLRKASAVWNGSLKEGKGKISTESKVLSNAQYSFSTRFEDGIGTNPEELIAAAHAGCFSMALSAQLGNAGMTRRINRNDRRPLRSKKRGRIHDHEGSSRCVRQLPGANALPLKRRPKMPRRAARFRAC